MTTKRWPAMADVLPHRAPMVLLDRIVAHDEGRTVCAVDITAATAFLTDAKDVPAWVGLEYMAQCVAAHAGLLARIRGEPVKLGLLIGARRVEFHVGAFEIGRTVIVTGAHVWGDRQLASFACSLSDERSATVLAESVLSVYAPSGGVLDLPS
jgi:predicted hotdog family 3-hydroxylacyl-ACP dehydratase